MGQALYRKHRPKALSEIVGQEHITTTLKQALDTGRVSHAYLFTGPRGTGKTSIARILAHEINKLPYTDDATHMDIIEIDAASNRRIDEIRELRDKVYVAPTSATYKVYIIDEVHMLTKEAFNALLKTLEEPPAHVIFILATTDAHKLPETIISRTQRFSFKPVEQAKVIEHLKQIATAENITVSDDALALLAQHGEGSFRDSISLLDQASNSGKTLELSDVQALLGIPSLDATEGIISTIATSAGSATLMSQLTALYDQGYQATAIAKQLAQLIRGQIASNALSLSADQAFTLLDQLIEVPIAHDPERFLEITLLKAHGLQTNHTPPRPQVAAAPAKPKLVQEAPAQKQPAPAPEPIEQPRPAEEAVTAPDKPVVAVDDDLWPQVLGALKQKHNTLYGVVRMAQPEFTEDNLVLTFKFAFHQKRIGEAANRQILSDIITQLMGKPIGIECVLNKDADTPQVVAAMPVSTSVPPVKDSGAASTVGASASLSTISNIFGGAELLES